MRDDNGQALAYVYARENAADAQIANVLTTDEAWRIAKNIAKLPALLKGRALELEAGCCGRPAPSPLAKQALGATIPMLLSSTSCQKQTFLL